MITKNNLVKITDYLREIPKSYRQDMRVPARIYATEKILDEINRDRSLEQLVNLTTLPGIQKIIFNCFSKYFKTKFVLGGLAGVTAQFFL